MWPGRFSKTQLWWTRLWWRHGRSLRYELSGLAICITCYLPKGILNHSISQAYSLYCHLQKNLLPISTSTQILSWSIFHRYRNWLLGLVASDNRRVQSTISCLFLILHQGPQQQGQVGLIIHLYCLPYLLPFVPKDYYLPFQSLIESAQPPPLIKTADHFIKRDLSWPVFLSLQQFWSRFAWWCVCRCLHNPVSLCNLGKLRAPLSLHFHIGKWEGDGVAPRSLLWID